MARIAVECIKYPQRTAVWSTTLGSYVCPDTPHRKAARREVEPSTDSAEHQPVEAAVLVGPAPAAIAGRPPLDRQFKLVFITATAGTFFFIILCVASTIIAGKEPPPLLTEIVRALADLAKIGFGAIVGLLGGKSLHGEPAK